jgi:hypothetical protein
VTLTTAQGSATARFTAAARAGRARLLAGPSRIDLGDVRVGHSDSAELSISNAGTVPLEITRAIAPLGPFTAPFAVPEGISLDPGSSLRIRILFTPTRRGRFSGRYLLRGDDGRGPRVVTFAGRGI